MRAGQFEKAQISAGSRSDAAEGGQLMSRFSDWLPGTGIAVRCGNHNWIQGNQIVFNGVGIQVEPSDSITLRRNSIYSNDGKGISLSERATQQAPPPAIIAIAATRVSGTAACPFCTVEVFSDDEDEGRITKAPLSLTPPVTRY